RWAIIRLFLPIIASRSGQVTNQVGQDALIVGQPLELGVLLGAQGVVAAAQLVVGLGPLVDLLLEGLEQLELGGRRDAVVVAAATGLAATTAATATAALAGVAAGLRLEGFEELLEPAGGGLGGPLRLR